MMSSQQNETITRVGKGTPAGQLLRRYWQPVALVEELPAERPVKAVRLMGQDFVVFKDEQGRYGMLDRDCPHRGADLAAGRLEGGGLRCAFHGWLFDASGRCLSTPGEPVGSTLCNKVRQSAYPVIEKAGVLFGYIGNDEPPAFPNFDCFAAPDAYTFAFKGLFECNWLQALEVGIDPAHASFLHRFFEDHESAARIRIAGNSREPGGLRPASHREARARRSAYACACDQCRVPASVRDSDELGDDDHAMARARRR
jgi:phenylpropionate dioxygenase-like ring-hydroxylating dioxygenase large terminal subunit